MSHKAEVFAGVAVLSSLALIVCMVFDRANSQKPTETLEVALLKTENKGLHQKLALSSYRSFLHENEMLPFGTCKDDGSQEMCGVIADGGTPQALRCDDWGCSLECAKGKP